MIQIKKIELKKCSYCPAKIKISYNACYICNKNRNTRPIIKNCFDCNIEKNNIYKYCIICYDKHRHVFLNLTKGNVKI